MRRFPFFVESEKEIKPQQDQQIQKQVLREHKHKKINQKQNHQIRELQTKKLVPGMNFSVSFCVSHRFSLKMGYVLNKIEDGPGEHDQGSATCGNRSPPHSLFISQSHGYPGNCHTDYENPGANRPDKEISNPFQKKTEIFLRCSLCPSNTGEPKQGHPDTACCDE
ncbi:MAG: hypothetical protein Q8P24_16535 [Desulfobacterales bacterium]|nr:hypothetical protein [Desulfobacterales bacterium]